MAPLEFSFDVEPLKGSEPKVKEIRTTVGREIDEVFKDIKSKIKVMCD